MQALRVASFMNRPTLLVIETLVMIGPYLTNSGKFLDAWALFGVTIRLAQSIGCGLPTSRAKSLQAFVLTGI
jgi:mannose-1-phosphate guanylyltransferase